MTVVPLHSRRRGAPPGLTPRAAVLRATGLLDSAPEAAFDRLTRLAAALLRTPVALVSLVDTHRQLVKSSVGLPEPWAAVGEIPLSHSLCQHVAATGRPLAIDDARAHPLVCDSGAVRDMGVVAYLGAPLTTEAGATLGSICVIDVVPRAWAAADLAGLADLAAAVMSEISLHAEAAERGRVESALRDSEARHRELLLALPVVIYQAAPTPPYGPLFVSPAVESLLGYPHAEWLARPDMWVRVLHPDDRERVLRETAAALGAGVPVDYEYRMVAADGTTRWVHDRGDFVRDADGRAVAWQGIMLDVTARRAAEATLREREAHLSLIYDNASDLMFLIEVGPAGAFRCVSVNRAYLARTGLAPEQLLGRRVEEILTPPAAAFVLARYANAAAAGAPVAYEETHDLPGGRLVAETTLIPVLDARGACTYLLGVSRDVTRRRDAEAALKASEERYRSAVDAVQDVIFQTDAAGHWTFLNPAWLTLTGHAVEASIGRECLGYVHADDRAAVAAAARLLAVGPASVRHELRIVSADGRERWVEAHARLLCGADGEFAGIAGVLHDVTKRRELDRLKNEFVSTVSHELRTPLTSIRGSLALLDAGAVGAIPARAAELVGIALRNVERLTRLLNDVLDLAKIEAGRVNMAVNPIDAAELVATAVEAMRGMASQHGVELAACAEPAPGVVGDRDRLLQVLTNLLSNAIKFSPRGAVVRAAARADAGGVRLEVCDAGPGIPPAQRDRLFQKFQQLDGSDSRRHGGTGLGLAIAKALVEQHGGRIGVESPPGGATFWVLLPAAADAAADAAAAPAAWERGPADS